MLKPLPLLMVLATVSLAAPNPGADRMRMARIRGPMQRAVKNPKLFDGTNLPPDADLRAADQMNAVFAQAIRMFESDWPQISPEAQGSPDGQQMKHWYDEAKPYAAALSTALAARKQSNAATAKAAKDERDAANQKCYQFWPKVDAGWGVNALNIKSGSGSLSQSNAKEAKAAFEKIGSVCAANGGAAGLAHCTDVGHKYQARYTSSEVCEAVTQPQDLLRDGLLRGMAQLFENKASLLISAEKLKQKEGWIETTEVFHFDQFFVFSDADRKNMLAEWKPVFESVGLTVPADSPVFDKMKETKDKLRAAVEELAATFAMPEGKPCSGYWCPLVKKSVLEWHPKAKILKLVQSGKVGLAYTGQRATSAYMDGFVLFQVPGEKWCQLRSWSVSEHGTGKADGVPLYYVRVQKCN